MKTSHERLGSAFANILAIAAMAFVLAGALGCSKQNNVFSVSGTVMYKGQPVPKGEIMMLPDSTKGNRGPSVVALIEDGRYQTPQGKGVVGGPYSLMITGYQTGPKSPDPTAPEYGRSIFGEQVRHVDFPKEHTTHDIAID